MSKAKKAQRKRARAKDRREKYLSVRAAPRLRPTVGDFYAVEAVQLYRRPQSWGEVNEGDLLKVVARTATRSERTSASFGWASRRPRTFD